MKRITFDDAMAMLTSMFENIPHETIVSVLRKKNGHLESAIEELLLISSGKTTETVVPLPSYDNNQPGRPQAFYPSSQNSRPYANSFNTPVPQNYPIPQKYPIPSQNQNKQVKRYINIIPEDFLRVPEVIYDLIKEQIFLDQQTVRGNQNSNFERRGSVQNNDLVQIPANNSQSDLKPRSYSSYASSSVSSRDVHPKAVRVEDTGFFKSISNMGSELKQKIKTFFNGQKGYSKLPKDDENEDIYDDQTMLCILFPYISIEQRK